MNSDNGRFIPSFVQSEGYPAHPKLERLQLACVVTIFAPWVKSIGASPQMLGICTLSPSLLGEAFVVREILNEATGICAAPIGDSGPPCVAGDRSCTRRIASRCAQATSLVTRLHLTCSLDRPRQKAEGQERQEGKIALQLTHVMIY